MSSDYDKLFGEWGLVEHPVGVQLKRIVGYRG